MRLSDGQLTIIIILGLSVLREEIVLGMQLLGVTSLDQLTGSRVRFAHGSRL